MPCTYNTVQVIKKKKVVGVAFLNENGSDCCGGFFRAVFFQNFEERVSSCILFNASSDGLS